MSYYYTYCLGKWEIGTGKVSLAGPYDEKDCAVCLWTTR